MAAGLRVSLTLPYKKLPNGKGGSYECAIVSVNLALPATNAPRSRRFEAYIDSGASSCLFHGAIGRAIGLEVQKGEVRETLGIHGRSSIFMHDIALYAPGGIIYLRAGFSEELPILGLLSMCGFFDHFKIAFDPTASACTLDRLFLAQLRFIPVLNCFHR